MLLGSNLTEYKKTSPAVEMVSFDPDGTLLVRTMSRIHRKGIKLP